MSEQVDGSTTRQGWIVPMRARAPDEEHRTATPLELYFDLVFVVAVAQAALALHHALAEGHVAGAVVSYTAVFFAIWWAWMNFTWFASAYDCGDVLYRLVVFVQMTGALVLAAGVPQAFNEGNFTLAVAGYVLMRLALVAEWVRAGRADPARRVTAYRYAVGVAACQIGWVLLLFVSGIWFPISFVLLVAAELLVPVWAERATPTTWHAEHIQERYGLFTIIVLGESILATSIGIQATLEAGEFTRNLLTLIVGGLLIIFSMWWLYFDRPMDGILSSLRKAFVWGYGHLFVFAATAAVGAGLSVGIDHALQHAEIGVVGAGAAVAIPVAIYLVTLWVLHGGHLTMHQPRTFLLPVVAFLVLLTPFSNGQAPLLTGMLLVALVAVKLAGGYGTAAHHL